MSTKRILVVEDDASILRGIRDALVHESFEVLTAADGEQGYRLIGRERPDLVILDVMLPKMDGFELCRRVRSEGVAIPILILTARGAEADRVKGLDIGADDYLSKPFSLPELMARVRALLRRVPQTDGRSASDVLVLGDVMIDFQKFEAVKGGITLGMSRKEFGILRYLMSRPGVVVTRDELLNAVWGYDRFPTTRTVDNHVALIRSKIETDPAQPRFLITVHGVGYKLLL
jgi:DNA-binding response OmpR family regulator